MRPSAGLLIAGIASALRGRPTDALMRRREKLIAFTSYREMQRSGSACGMYAQSSELERLQ
jgi:hypothetical protein